MSDSTTPGELTDAEKLTALQTYLKFLAPMEKALREKVTADLAARKVEKVGAYLPDGTKLGSVSHTPGRVSAKITDEAAALRYCEKRYPEEIVKAVRSSFLTMLVDNAKKVGKPGDKGVDPYTGEILDFIEVGRGNPFVTVTTTSEGVDRMGALASGFVGMLEAPAAKVYDADFADRLENGAYDR